jgi:hypothetical protein
MPQDGCIDNVDTIQHLTFYSLEFYCKNAVFNKDQFVCKTAIDTSFSEAGGI